MNNCPKCNREMETYYGPWCPVCDKPVVDPRPTLNLLKALRHIEVSQDRPGYKEEMWNWFIDQIPENDCYITFYPDWIEEYEEDGESVAPNLRILVDTFQLQGVILLEVSW